VTLHLWALGLLAQLPQLEVTFHLTGIINDII